ncbi:ribonuclease III [Anaerotruncus sp. 1XD22-93]|nr:ribonuclease III [Lachnospiraceae bacterium]NBI75830.1 ribonuclease III [Lachnospiraceae bacterium]RKJ88731.1 ribonuclease III [Anaerotruncus sp. 1XD22-93]
MEKGVIFMMEYLREAFGMEDVDLRTYSPLTLAYIGDAIYDLIIRTLIVKQGNSRPEKMHKRASALVKASAQAEMIERLLPMLTEEEHAIYKRGRNAKSYTMAKNATMLDYRKATGFEALMGYLYLKEDMSRLIDLVKAGLDKGEQE